MSAPSCHDGRARIHRSGSKMTSNRLPRIILFAAPETSAAVLYGLYDVLGSVGLAWPDVTSATSGDRLLDVRIVAATSEPFRCYGGVRIEPHERHRRRDRRRRGRRLRHVHAHRRAAARPVPGGVGVAPRDARARRADRERLRRVAPARRVRAARREVLRGALGLRGPLRLVLPSRAVQGGLDSRPLERGCGDRDRRWRDVLAGACPLPHRALLRAGPGHADGQGLPPRGAPGWSAAVLGDDSQVAPRGSRRRGERHLDRGATTRRPTPSPR